MLIYRLSANVFRLLSLTLLVLAICGSHIALNLLVGYYLLLLITTIGISLLTFVIYTVAPKDAKQVVAEQHRKDSGKWDKLVGNSVVCAQSLFFCAYGYWFLLFLAVVSLISSFFTYAWLDALVKEYENDKLD